MSVIPEDATTLLQALSNGNPEAKKKLFDILYKELHTLSHKAMRSENPGHILQTTALIHEAYLHMVDTSEIHCNDRAHFFHIAARAMRQILVSEARSRKAAKRGYGWHGISLEHVGEPEQKPEEAALHFNDLDALDQALDKLEQDENNRRICRVVELLFFAGLTQDQAAEVLSISKSTVRRDWDFAKVWLLQEMKRL